MWVELDVFFSLHWEDFVLVSFFSILSAETRLLS